MNCKTANQLIRPYLDRELSLEEADNFLKHIRECKECREELEIYFTVQAGIENLNQDEFQTYDLKELFEVHLHREQVKIHRQHWLNWSRDVSLAGAIAGIVIVCMLQFQIWF